MSRKIESLLQVIADFQDFCEPNTSFISLSHPNNELNESDLDLIAAAATNPSCPNISLPEKD